MNEILQKISEIRIVPVVAIDRAEDAIPLGKALMNGGIPCAEVTFRTDAAESAIKIMSKEFPDMLVGAGTVLKTEQVDSDIEAALEFDLEVVKFFPAEALGGLPLIKAMSAPYGNVKFMPTGGINASNICKYLEFKKVIACGGSWMVDKKLVAEGRFDEIEKLCREAVELVKGVN